MSTIRSVVVALALLLAPFAMQHQVVAGETTSLFVNATTDESHRAQMALGFAQKQLERKHPVTIFLNDRGVRIGSLKKSKFKAHREMLAAMMKAGASVYICPTCMEKYDVKKKDLMEGIQVGNPDLVGAALFKDDTRTLTW
ncbi:MAG: DsrE family protein [Hyphomicrobiaceae bacterium]|nr:DsrE family protein [Hyphomicrobiaceae bacterium]